MVIKSISKPASVTASIVVTFEGHDHTESEYRAAAYAAAGERPEWCFGATVDQSVEDVTIVRIARD